MTISNNEKITKLEEKIEEQKKKIKQMQAQKNSLIAREKEKERKARTRRLIEMGALLNELGITTKEQLTKFINEYKRNEKCKSWFDKIINE